MNPFDWAIIVLHVSFEHRVGYNQLTSHPIICISSADDLEKEPWTSPLRKRLDCNSNMLVRCYPSVWLVCEEKHIRISIDDDRWYGCSGYLLDWWWDLAGPRSGPSTTPCSSSFASDAPSSGPYHAILIIGQCACISVFKTVFHGCGW